MGKGAHIGGQTFSVNDCFVGYITIITGHGKHTSHRRSKLLMFLKSGMKQNHEIIVDSATAYINVITATVVAAPIEDFRKMIVE